MLNLTDVVLAYIVRGYLILLLRMARFEHHAKSIDNRLESMDNRLEDLIAVKRDEIAAREQANAEEGNEDENMED